MVVAEVVPSPKLHEKEVPRTLLFCIKVVSPKQETGVTSKSAKVIGKLKSNLQAAINNLNEGKEWSDAMETFSPMDRAGLRASTDATKISRTLKDLSLQYKNTYQRAVGRVATTLFFIGMFYLGVAALLLFAYTTIPVLDGLGNGLQ